PPGLSPTVSDTVLNSSVTAYLSRRFLNAIRLLWVPFSTDWLFSTFDLVINGSTNSFKALALATVVLILLCSIREQAIFANIAFLCAVFLPKWLIFLPCLIVCFYITSLVMALPVPKKILLIFIQFIF